MGERSSCPMNTRLTGNAADGWSKKPRVWSAHDRTTYAGTGRHQTKLDDTRNRDPFVTRATLGSGGREAVGVRVSPLAPTLTYASLAWSLDAALLSAEPSSKPAPRQDDRGWFRWAHRLQALWPYQQPHASIGLESNKRYRIARRRSLPLPKARVAGREDAMITRRQFLNGGLAAGAGLVALPRLRSSKAFAAAAQTPLAGSSIPQFVDPLPSLDVILAGADQIELRMTEFKAQVLPKGCPKTWVWGYLQPGQSARPTYLGPVIVAERGTPTQIKWVNDLGDTSHTHLKAWVDSTDQTVHWADPLNGGTNACAESVEPHNPPTGPCALHYSGPIPGTPHLHGGEVPPSIDGGPDSWFTSDGSYVGPAYYSEDGTEAKNHSIYRYPNVQEAAPIWFHDHTLGLTRLSVYAGLAGGYLITDPDDGSPANLPLPTPLIIQDRMFDTDGQLFFPAGIPFTPNPEHPFWVPEFIGDTIAVNGKVWPYLEVEPKRYRFLFLDGSNARGYELFLTNPASKTMAPSIWQIGTDGGYLDGPVKIDPNAPKGALQRLLILPGERADVIIDFAGLAPGTRLLLRNIAKAPYPGGEAPQGSTTGRVMQFRVVPSTGPDTSYDPATHAPLRTPMVRLVDPAVGTLASDVAVQKTRQLTLNEVIGEPSEVGGVMYEGGPLEILVNNTELPGDRSNRTSHRSRSAGSPPTTPSCRTKAIPRSGRWSTSPRTLTRSTCTSCSSS